MANDHPAFFGNDAEPAHEPGAIPADLLPYLEAADAPDELALTDVTGQSDEDAAEDERTAALRALVESSLLLGPDPSILAEIEDDEVDDEFSEDAAAARAERERAAHDAALEAAADSVALDERVASIYDAIVARAPEHKFDPTVDRVRAVLDILGDPQNSYPSVHITGTNG